ncbi:hypothetical protein JW979_14265 [bacterium]|nr:hypothetical protein [candidate division CSSED10-310 bacterium]
MSTDDLKSIIKELKKQQDDIRTACMHYIEQEKEVVGTNITYHGLDGILTQNDLPANSWVIGASWGSIAVNMSVLMDPWGEENRMRMMFPMAEWVRLDRLLRNLGVTIQPQMQPWEMIGVVFILCFMNGYQFIYPWGNYVLVQPKTKPRISVDAIDKSEHELTLSVMLKQMAKRQSKDMAVLCIYPEAPVFSLNNFTISGNYFHSAIGRKFQKLWNDYCEHEQKYNWICDGAVFKNCEDNFICAGGENLEDIAVVFEKDRKIISPGIQNGCYPGTTMVTFNLIGEAAGYEIETRAITMADIKKAEWGVVTENATFLLLRGLIDPWKQEFIPVTKGSEYRFRDIFLKTFIRIKNGDSRTLGLPRLIEKADEWFPSFQDRKAYAEKGLDIKRRAFAGEAWRNIKIALPRSEVQLKQERMQITTLYGKYWDLPKLDHMLALRKALKR